MAVFVMDTSALAKRYVLEMGSHWLRALVSPSAGHSIYIARITAVELIAALTRQERAGALSAADAFAARAAFRIHLTSEYRPIEVSTDLIARAMALAEKYALRGYDAVQLATALAVNESYRTSGLSPITLVSADAELNLAAASESLHLEDPNRHR